MYVPSDLKTELRRESAILGSAMLLYFVLGTGLTVIASAAMSLFTGQGVSDFYEGGYGTVAVLADICCYLLSFAVPAYLLSKGMEWPLARPKKPFGLLTVPTFFVMLQAVNIFTSVFNELFRRVGIKGYSAGLELPGTPLGWLLFLMQYTLLPAVFEELLFRGAIL